MAACIFCYLAFSYWNLFRISKLKFGFLDLPSPFHKPTSTTQYGQRIAGIAVLNPIQYCVPANLGHWRLFCPKNAIKLGQHVFGIDELVDLVPVIVRLPQILEIKVIVLINFNDAFQERFFASVVVVIDKTFWIEIEMDKFISPINRETANSHWVSKFFRRITWIGRILEGNCEFVLFEKRLLVFDEPADIVHHSSASIDTFVLHQLVKEADPLFATWI